MITRDNKVLSYTNIQQISSIATCILPFYQVCRDIIMGIPEVERHLQNPRSSTSCPGNRKPTETKPTFVHHDKGRLKGLWTLRSGHVTHLKRFFLKRYMFLLPTYLVYQNLFCGTLICPLSIWQLGLIKTYFFKVKCETSYSNLY